MPTLHDGAYRAEIQRRLRELRPDSERRWGKMSVDQMLWHVNEAMEVALGTKSATPKRPPLPGPVMKFLVLNLPWPKGAPSLPDFIAKESHDFEDERNRCVRLIDDLARKNLNSEWLSSPALGTMSGLDVTRLHAKHMNHHLRQFGV